jgi:hypothetical protein
MTTIIKHGLTCQINCLFGSVVAVAFQIAFRAKMHANDVFLFFKNYF